MTRPGKTVLSTQIPLFILWHVSPVLMCYPKYVVLLNSLWISAYVYDDILDTILITDKK